MLDEPAQILDLRIKPKFSYSSTEFNFFFKGQQWTEENKVGKLSDGPPDFEGNGIFSKLLLDVSPVFV